MKLSVIVPCYNEIKYIREIISRIKLKNHSMNIEIIVVDDNSLDGTKSELNLLKNENKIDHLVLNDKNMGKGFCVREGIKLSSGQVILIQDADLEYDPSDYKTMLSKMKKDKLKCLYGSRVLGKSRYKQKNFISFFRVLANHFLTILTNIIYCQKLTDAHTCYKMIDHNLIKKFDLKEKGFAFCPELTAKVSKSKIKIEECEISYKGRTYKEGKKISIFDGLQAIWVLIKYRFYD